MSLTFKDIPTDVYFILTQYVGMPEIFGFIKVSAGHSRFISTLLKKRFDLCSQVWYFLLKEDRKRVLIRQSKSIILNDVYIALVNIQIKRMIKGKLNLHEMYVKHSLKTLINRHRISRSLEIKKGAMQRHMRRFKKRARESVPHWVYRMTSDNAMGHWIPYNMSKYKNRIIPLAVSKMLKRSHDTRVKHFSREGQLWGLCN